MPYAERTSGKNLETPEWVARFLEVFRDTGNVRLACHATGISRPTPFAYREKDPEFARAWKDAEEDACDLLEAEARKRARATSDTLMIFLLKAHRPEKYRDVSRIEHLIGKMNVDELDQFIAGRLADATAGSEARDSLAALPAGDGGDPAPE